MVTKLVKVDREHVRITEGFVRMIYVKHLIMADSHETSIKW